MMDTPSSIEVYILSVRKYLPAPDSCDEELSAHSRQILRPLSLLRETAIYVYPGEEFVVDRLYCREWAILIDPNRIGTLKLDPSIFMLRQIYTTELFPGKYKDLLLGPGYVKEFPVGTLDWPAAKL